jgi:hypothetical protein
MLTARIGRVQEALVQYGGDQGKLPGAAESLMSAAPLHAGPHTTGLQQGHATADRVAAGVISLTGGWTGRGAPDSLGTCGSGLCRRVRSEDF